MRMLSTSRRIAVAAVLTLLFAAQALPSPGGRERAGTATGVAAAQVAHVEASHARRRRHVRHVARRRPCPKSSAEALPCGPGEHLCLDGPKAGECLPNDTACPTGERKRRK
jgi:hypothetical protein